MLTFRSLKYHPFALLWSGQTISRFGDSFYTIALSWWILEKTHSAAAMGVALIFGRVPLLLFLLFGGVAVDRFPRARIMLISDLLRGSIVTVIALLSLNNSLEVWHIYFGSALFGFTGAFFTPAYTALIPEIVPRETLPSANSLTSLSRELASVIGPSLAAFVVSLSGTTLAFGLNAVSFFISALCLLPLLGLSTVSVSGGRPSNVLIDAKDGFHLVLESPWLWINIAFFSLYNITAGGAFTVVLPLLIRDRLNAGVEGLGFLVSMLSLGSVLGAILLGRLTEIRRRGLTAYYAATLNGMMIVVVGWTTSIIVAASAMAMSGMLMTILSLIWFNTLQTLVPRGKLGRVASIDNFGSELLTPVGFAVAGWVADQFGPASIFIIGGGFTAMLSVFVLLHPAIRKLD